MVLSSDSFASFLATSWDSELSSSKNKVTTIVTSSAFLLYIQSQYYYRYDIIIDMILLCVKPFSSSCLWQ